MVDSSQSQCSVCNHFTAISLHKSFKFNMINHVCMIRIKSELHDPCQPSIILTPFILQLATLQRSISCHPSPNFFTTSIRLRHQAEMLIWYDVCPAPCWVNMARPDHTPHGDNGMITTLSLQHQHLAALPLTKLHSSQGNVLIQTLDVPVRKNVLSKSFYPSCKQ